MNSADGSLFVVSPHLDDAVFGCATLLAAQPGATVCTVFAGTPRAPQIQPWDEAAGFSDSSEAMRARTLGRTRDSPAISRRPVWRTAFCSHFGEGFTRAL
ncbi:PIG-L family deacetylase [Paraburkholderia tropica]|uniref:PIG-L family deacetylase n=1 Tax=Paraburkholderia tropica TaxID=92647 RepID=A0AAQ1GN91_9BURK|nr:hypothetical protein [Paraburkholderia tropica]RQN34014.1 hypothetical protein EHZ25_36810 [Paraburkholderia tropica]SEK14164.1 hypothetical protein SAMN05216550_12718 [Paraburkholderia tropica]